MGGALQPATFSSRFGKGGEGGKGVQESHLRYWQAYGVAAPPHWASTERRAQEIPKFAKFANFLNFSGASQKLNACKSIILIILAPRKK